MPPSPARPRPLLAALAIALPLLAGCAPSPPASPSAAPDASRPAASPAGAAESPTVGRTPERTDAEARAEREAEDRRQAIADAAAGVGTADGTASSGAPQGARAEAEWRREVAACAEARGYPVVIDDDGVTFTDLEPGEEGPATAAVAACRGDIRLPDAQGSDRDPARP